MGITFDSKIPYFGSITVKGYRHKTNAIEYGRFGTFYIQAGRDVSFYSQTVEKTISFDNALILPEISTTGQEDVIDFVFGVSSPERAIVAADPSDSGLLYADIILLAWAVTHGVDGIVFGDDEFVDYEFERGLVQ